MLANVLLKVKVLALFVSHSIQISASAQMKYLIK